MKNKVYYVEVISPFYIEADNEEEAKEKALEMLGDEEAVIRKDPELYDWDDDDGEEEDE